MLLEFVPCLPILNIFTEYIDILISVNCSQNMKYADCFKLQIQVSLYLYLSSTVLEFIYGLFFRNLGMVHICSELSCSSYLPYFLTFRFCLCRFILCDFLKPIFHVIYSNHFYWILTLVIMLNIWGRYLCEIHFCKVKLRN